MRPDILLVQPPYGGEYNFWKSECLGMGYLASALEAKGYSVKIIDAFLLDMSVEETVQEILAAPPHHLLGFSMLSYELYRTGQSTIERLRRSGWTTHVTLGSWFPTFWYEQIIAERTQVDSIVLGEGERAICMLADYVRTGSWPREDGAGVKLRQIDNTLVVDPRADQTDLNLLAHPRRDFFDVSWQHYHLSTCQSSRGCGHNRCTFCSVPAFYANKTNHRLRAADDVIEEVAKLARMGADFVFFTDEDFVGQAPDGPQRALDIFQGAADRGLTTRYTFNCTVSAVDETLFGKLRELGLRAAYIGIESNHARCLKRFGKGVGPADVERAVATLKDLDIKLVPGWIMFERESTLEEVEESITFLRDLDAYHVNFVKALYVMSDTPMERLYGPEVYKTYFHTRYFYRNPQVDLLVRILMTDYLPEVMPHTNNIYPIWHKLLAGYGNREQQQRYDSINRSMRELSLGFVEDTIRRIRSNSLDGLARELTWQVQQWTRLGQEIHALVGAI